MKKILPVLGVLLGAWIFSISAYAGTAAQSTSSQERAHSAVPAWYGTAAKGMAFYSTFNSDQSNLYDCCVAWTVSTTASALAFQQFIAMPFTPTQAYTLKSVQLGLSYFEGTNSLVISVAKDKGGLPGKTMATFTVTGIPPGGSCCDVEAVTPKGVKVKANTQYWIVVTATADTWGGWNEDSTGASGNFAFDAGSGWTLTSGTLGAFAVAGK